MGEYSLEGFRGLISLFMTVNTLLGGFSLSFAFAINWQDFLLGQTRFAEFNTWCNDAKENSSLMEQRWMCNSYGYPREYTDSDAILNHALRYSDEQAFYVSLCILAMMISVLSGILAFSVTVVPSVAEAYAIGDNAKTRRIQNMILTPAIFVNVAASLCCLIMFMSATANLLKVFYPTVGAKWNAHVNKTRIAVYVFLGCAVIYLICTVRNVGRFGGSKASERPEPARL